MSDLALPQFSADSFVEVIRSAMMSECRRAVERVGEDFIRALEAAFTAAPAEPHPEEVSDPPPNAHEVRRQSLQLGKDSNIRNSKANVIPRMMMLDMDFGGNLNADSVCARFNFHRATYHEYKKVVLGLYRCHKDFGGKMNMTQTCQTLKICKQTAESYMKIMKEGFHV